MNMFVAIKHFMQDAGLGRFSKKGGKTEYHSTVINAGGFKSYALSRAEAYGLAVSTTVLAWLIDLLLGNRFSHSSGGLYVAAAFISTWFGGMGPGLLAISLTA